MLPPAQYLCHNISVTFLSLKLSQSKSKSESKVQFQNPSQESKSKSKSKSKSRVQVKSPSQESKYVLNSNNLLHSFPCSMEYMHLPLKYRIFSEMYKTRGVIALSFLFVYNKHFRKHRQCQLYVSQFPRSQLSL